MWLLYFSAYKLGQTFLRFQWDILLLEAGGVAVVTAPLLKGRATAASAHVGLFLARWLLFRLMFQSGRLRVPRF